MERNRENKKQQKEVTKISKKYPSIPSEIFDIEASDEMADIYYDTFGY